MNKQRIFIIFLISIIGPAAITHGMIDKNTIKNKKKLTIIIPKNEVSRSVMKKFSKIPLSPSTKGNTKKIYNAMVNACQDHFHDEKKMLADIDNEIGKLIGKKYSKDPDISKGVTLWLKEMEKKDKSKVLLLKKLINAYISGKALFVKKLWEKHFAEKNEVIRKLIFY